MRRVSLPAWARLVFLVALLMSLVLIAAPSALAAPTLPLPPAVAVEDDGPAKSSPSRIAAESAAPDRIAATLTVDGACVDADLDLVCDSASDTYKTIQKAIDVAAAGDAINVLAGTYTENVLINKSVTLTGAGAATTTVYPAVSNPNPCTGSSLCGGATSASNIIVVAASNVAISGLTLDGDNPALTSGIIREGADLNARNGVITDHSLGVPFPGLEVHHTTVKNIYLRGMYASTDGTFNFHDNTVTNVQGDSYSIAMFAWYGPGTMANNTVAYANDAISANHSRGIQFLNNTVTHSGSGIHTDNSIDGGGTADLIQGNTVNDCATDGYGIWVFVPYVAPTVDGNTITNCAVGLSAWGQGAAVTTNFTNNVVDGAGLAGSTGVYVTTDLISWGYSDVSVSFTGNVIKNNAYGLAFTADQQSWNPESFVAKTITAAFSNNGITGNSVTASVGTQGIYNLNASGNWWGSADAATVKAAANGGVLIDYTPWLGVGTDTSADPGFQGDFANLWVDDDSPQTGTVGRVQEGVNLATAGGTVNVAAGTYDTAATNVVNKALTLAGPTSGVAKLQGTNSAVVPVLSIEASNVTVQNLEFTHSALVPFASAPTPWTELANSLVRVTNGTGLTGISITGNSIYVPVQPGAMSTWNGVALSVGWGAANGISITNNTIHHTRNGIVVQYNNTATLSNNTIYSTKGGIMNYTTNQADASNRMMSGNAWGTVHNEWDVVWNSGSYYLPTDRSVEILGVSAANSGAYVVDKRSPDAASGANLTGNRSHIFVDAASTFIAPNPGRGSFNEPFQNLDLAWQAVIPGGTVYVFKSGTYTVSPGEHPGGVVVTGDGATIDLGGATVGAGSPAFTIVGDDVTLMNGVLDGNVSTSPGVLVADGADNFILDRMEIREWADGVEVAGSHASLKLVKNWIHSNTDAGLQVNTGAVLDGIVTVEGNLFKVNGVGVKNETTVLLNAEYNSWGTKAAPPAMANVDADPWTFSEIYFDVDPTTVGDQYLRHVNETNTFDVKLMAEAENLWGLGFKFTFDTARLTLNSTTLTAPGACADLSQPAAGIIKYACNQTEFGTEWDGGVIATFNFTAKPGPAGNGPWHALFDVDHAVANTFSAAKDGIRVFVNNAGFNDPSTEDRNIADTDPVANDGEIIIDGLANYSGYVDLQGRANDSGATFEVYNQAAWSGAVKYAGGTTASSGKYTTAYVSPWQLVINQTYYFQVDRALYLPTTAVASYSGPAPTGPWAHSKVLGVRPLQSVNTVILLGGDATNDNMIDSDDSGCIGFGYGQPTPPACGSAGSADVNGDGLVDILDLTLMGGNYTKNSSAPSWAP